MFVTAFGAIPKLDRLNTKLAMVKLILMLMVTVPYLALDGKSQYYYTSKITPLLFRSCLEQCKENFKLETYSYFSWHGFQSVILAANTIFVA